MQFDLHHALAAAELANHTGLIGLDKAVFELNTVHQLTHGGRRNLAGHLGDVGLRDAERGVREHVGEFAVVGEQQ